MDREALAVYLKLRYAVDAAIFRTNMRVISRRALHDFVIRKRVDSAPFDAWYRIVSKSDFRHFPALRATFNSVDAVGNFHVFDIAGNKYRIVAAIHFTTQKLYIRHVFTHSEYDKWIPS